MSSEPVPDPDSRALLSPGATAPPGSARLCRRPPPPRAGQPTPSCLRGEALTARPGRRFLLESMSWERLQQVRSLVDAMGARSAKAQGLACPITSLHKLAGSSQRLYISARQRAEQRMEVLGILKAGPKNLFIRDDAGRFHEICPPCVLDFYVHESCQRQGVGRALFEAYLSDQRTTAAGSGYDRPSPKFLAFLRKHYHLASYVPQANNFVVFREYFEHGEAAAMGAGASGDASGGSTGGGAGRPSPGAPSPPRTGSSSPGGGLPRPPSRTQERTFRLQSVGYQGRRERAGTLFPSRSRCRYLTAGRRPLGAPCPPGATPRTLRPGLPGCRPNPTRPSMDGAPGGSPLTSMLIRTSFIVATPSGAAGWLPREGCPR